MAADVAVGLFGKLPARGDFVCLGLPRDFVAPWDEWLSGVVAGSRQRMGADWLPAWLEAPVWRFDLPAGLCGRSAVLGLLIPSLDRVGRYFPLTLAAVLSDRSAPAHREADRWLDLCEVAGRAAVEQDAEPDAVVAMMPPLPPATQSGCPRPAWWTEGGPRVAARRMLGGLPETAAFAAMLADAAQVAP